MVSVAVAGSSARRPKASATSGVALALRALALVHVPDAVPAIEKVLKRAREK